MRRWTCRIVPCALIVLALVTGCKQEGDTLIVGPRLPGQFPGNDAADNHHALDGKALSENGESVMEGPRCFYSSQANRAIILYTTIDSIGPGATSLWASYFDGKAVTPPVEIVTVSHLGKQGDFFSAVPLDTAIVVFYHPSGEAGNTFPSQAGDAVILFARGDVDDSGPNLPNDSNVRLWWCYFDRSLAGKANEAHGFGTYEPDGTFRAGFADIVDSDDGVNDDTNQTAPFDNKEPDDVTAFGIVSDGLHGEAAFVDSGAFYRQTDFEDYLVAVWTQTDEVDISPTNDIDDSHLWWARFDFDVSGQGAPGFTTPLRIATDPSSPENAGGAYPEPDTLVGPLVLAYDNAITFIIGEVSDPDIVLQYNHFIGDLSSGSFFASSIQASPTNDPNDGDASFFDIFTGTLPTIYGGDHNLADLVMIYGHSVETATDGDLDLYMARFDPQALTASAAFNRTNDLAQVDLTGPNPSPPRDAAYPESRISRDNDYILVAFLQEDTLGEVELKAFRYRTDEIGSPPVGGDISNSIGSVLDVSDTAVDAPAFAFAFQDELGSAFVPPRETGARGIRRGAVQSDNNRMHLIYELNDDSIGTPVDLIHVAQFELPDLFSDGTIRTAQLDDLPNGTITSPDDLRDLTAVLDDGDGGVVIYYTRDRNFLSTTQDPDSRLNARRYDGLSMSGPIDVNTPGLQAYAGAFGALTFGTEDPAGSVHLVFFAEARFSTSGGFPASSLATRTRSFEKLGPGDAFGAGRFGSIHTVDTGQSVNSEGVGLTSAGGTADVALYIRQGGHLYYNEYAARTDSWKDAGDFIVDNDSEENIQAAVVTAFWPYFPSDLAISGETAGALAFWFRLDADGDYRLHLRIHK